MWGSGMSMPIKDTSILTGEEAIRFQEAINNPIPVSKDEYDKAEILFNNIVIIKLIGILCSLVDDIDFDGTVDSRYYKKVLNELLDL